MKIKKLVKSLIKKVSNPRKIPIYISVIEGNLVGNKSILITGGTGGIGFAIAKVCLQNGASVIIAGRNEERLRAAKNELLVDCMCCESRIQYIVLDISNIDDVKSKLGIAAALSPTKKIDVLINNAGVSGGGIITATTEAEYDKVLDVNLKGTYFMAQEFANYLLENKIKGNILNISSVSGIRPAISPYMISKWGINGLTKGLAKKLIKHEIVVNGIAPGPTATDMIKSDGKNLNYEKSPSQRFVDSFEIANLALFLISDMGRMIVGETIFITGGCGTLTLDDIYY